MKKSIFTLAIMISTLVASAQMYPDSTGIQDSTTNFNYCQPYIKYAQVQADSNKFTFYGWANQGMLTVLADIISYTWTFDNDTVVSHEAQPTYLFSKSDYHFVTLDIITKDSCTSSTYASIYTGQPVDTTFYQPYCQAYINAEPVISANTNSLYKCSAWVDNGTMTLVPVKIISYKWYFDQADITESTDALPVVNFIGNGYHSILVTTITEDSCVSTTKQQVYVGVVDTNWFNNGCVNFATFEQDYSNPNKYTFWGWLDKLNYINYGTADSSTAKLMNPATKEILTYYWKFEDADILESFEPSPVVVFNVTGYHYVTLTTMSYDSCTATSELYVYAGINKDTTVYGICQAYMSYNQDSSDFLKVNFSSFVDNGIDCGIYSTTDCIYNKPLKSIASKWYFENAMPSESSDLNPVVTYNNEGMFKVTLETMTEDSCISFTSQAVYVYVPKSCTPYVQAEVLPASFNGGTDGMIGVSNTEPNSTNYIYKWNDGSTSQNLTNAAPGVYYLTVTDPITNCINIYNYTIEDTYKYWNNVVDTLIAEPINKCVNYDANTSFFINNIDYYDTYVQLAWTFSDTLNNLKEIYSARYNYTKVGNQLVELIFHCDGSKGDRTFQSFVYLNPAKAAVVLGVKEQQSNQSAIEIYPNPAIDYVNSKLVLNEKSVVIVNVYNNEGQLVYQTQQELLQGNHTLIVPVADLSSGLYMMQINTQDKLYTAKFIK